MESQPKVELPSSFEHADIDHLVVLIADMLERLMAHNDQIPLSPESLTRFHSRTPPSISILEYLRRIVRYANVEKTCLLITLHYIDQICARIPHFIFSSLTCHRFVIAAIVVSSKALCDAFCTNAHYAKVGGIRVGELNVLEKEFLSLIDWRLTSTREVLNEYYVNLVRTHSGGGYAIAAPSSPASEAESDLDSMRSTPPHTPDAGEELSIASQERPPAPSLRGRDVAVATASSIANIGISIPIATVPAGRNVLASSSRLPVEPSTVLIDKATLSPRAPTGPTIEQNMAFAALRGPSASSSASPSTSTNAGAVPSPVPSPAGSGRIEKRAIEPPVEDGAGRHIRQRLDADLDQI